MKNILTTLLSIIFLCGNAHSQQYFNNIYDYNNGYDEFIHHNYTTQGFFLTGASFFDSSGFLYATFSMINDSGYSVWAKKYRYNTSDN